FLSFSLPSRRSSDLDYSICFFYIRCLSCQRTLICLKRIAMNNSSICCGKIPCFQNQNISWHHFFCQNFFFLSISNYLCIWRRKLDRKSTRLNSSHVS